MFVATPERALAVIDIVSTSRLVPSDTQPRGGIVGVNTRVENRGDEASTVTIVALMTFDQSITQYVQPLPTLDTCPRRLPCEVGDQCMDIGVLVAGAMRECTLYYRVRQDAPTSLLGLRVIGGPIVGVDIDFSNNLTEVFLRIVNAQPVPSLSVLSLCVLALCIALTVAYSGRGRYLPPS
jgi:hypothetical protein